MAATSIGAGVTLPILGAVGFAASGPVLGSAAAGWQAAMGAAVPAGSLFSILQGAAMGGAAVAGVTAAGAGAGAVVGGAAVGAVNLANRGNSRYNLLA